MSERATAQHPADDAPNAGRTRQMFALSDLAAPALDAATPPVTRKTRPLQPTPAPVATPAPAPPQDEARPAATRRLGACVRPKQLERAAQQDATPAPPPPRSPSEPSAARKTVARLEAIAPAPGATMGRAYGGSTAKTVPMRVEDLAAFHPRQRAQLEDGRTQQLSAVCPTTSATSALPTHLLLAVALGLLVLVACALLGLWQLI